MVRWCGCGAFKVVGVIGVIVVGLELGLELGLGLGFGWGLDLG